MGIFQGLLQRVRSLFYDDTPSEPTRKRRGDVISEPIETKVRCVEGPTFYGENNYRFIEHRANHSGTGLMPKSQISRFNQVQISKWDQNGKENCNQYLHTPFNPLKNTTMEHQQNGCQDSSDDIQVLEEHNHRHNRNSKRSKDGFRSENALPFKSGTADVEIQALPSPTKSSCGRKEVEVMKILQSPQTIKRHDSDIQIVKECTSVPRDGHGHRSASRKPFKAIDPSSSVIASSTPIAFMSRRMSVQSPREQPEIEVLPTSSLANGISSSRYTPQSPRLSSDSSYLRSGNTLSNVKRAEDCLLYNKLLMNSSGMERPLPFRIVSPPRGLSSTERHDMMSASTSNMTQTQHLRSPVDARIPKELSIPSKEETSCKRINIPVEINYEKEPSTSASRQQSEDPDLQYLGRVHAPHIAHQQYGEDVLSEILLKYRKMDELKQEAEEKEKEIRMIEERNKQAEIAHKRKLKMELEEQLEMYLKVVEEYEEKEEEEAALPVLSAEMQAEIDQALTAPQNAVLSTGFNLTIKGMDMRTLRPLTWLNDEVINFYMNLLIERGKADNYPAVYAFNTFFFPQLLGKGYDSLKRWTKKVDVFAHDYVLVPVHRGMHWCMAVIDMKEKVIRYYDSLDGRFPQCTDALLNYLQKESMDKKKQPFDTTGWKKEHAEGIPHQNNGSDCGMFACMYAEYVSRGAPITFTQDDMPYFRRKVVYEILKRKLLT